MHKSLMQSFIAFFLNTFFKITRVTFYDWILMNKNSHKVHGNGTVNEIVLMLKCYSNIRFCDI